MRQKDRGAAAVEFALILPILVLLVFGIIQYGYFFFQSTAVEAATRDASRRASIGGYTCGDLFNAVQNSAGVDARITSVGVTGAAVSGATQMTLTAVWTPTPFGFPVPFTTGNKTEKAVFRSENNLNTKRACP